MIFKLLIPHTTQVSGIIGKGDTHLKWSLYESWFNGTVSLIGENVTIYYKVEGENIPIPLKKVQLNIVLTKDCIQIKSLIDLANHGTLDAKFQISNLHKQRMLFGALHIHSLSISTLNPALIPGEKISGMLNTNLRFGENLKQPKIFGKIHLNNTCLENNLIPIKFTRSQFTINFKGMRSTLKAVIHAAQGKITLNGEAAWDQIDHWYTRISMISDRISVIIPPHIHMDIVPNLLFTATPKLYTLMGYINVPWAHFLAQKIPRSSTQISSDEVLLDKNLQPLKSRFLTIPTKSKILVHVGSNVSIHAVGLRGKLHGDIEIQKNHYSISMYGKMHILSGHLHAYAQDLFIRKGELKFSGCTIQPYLNIEAIRHPEETADDVTVGG
ncbi:translocation/assembly module TamB domain-containing protein [Candidatus Erwinia haradaeae]|uniref:translocation/assembly module TamB domain-containing protein n=1 Tax=Candidatus Erwinia haradaeae TaxID=1922217 RepID=UPI0013005660|nr:translocation/assembly module TamB domain-containing protein [Candidatus Erwinia haradaeae]